MRSICLRLLSTVMMCVWLSLVPVQCSGQDRTGGEEKKAESTEQEFDWTRGDYLKRIIESDDFKDELVILDHQVESIRDGYKALGNDFSERGSKLREKQKQEDVSREDARKQSSSLYSERNAAIDDLLNEELLKHQYSRLKELMVWVRINEIGGMVAFANDNVMRDRTIAGLELDLTGEMKSELEALDEEFQREVMELRQEYRDKLHQTLPKNKAAKLKAMLGSDSLFSLFGSVKVGF